MSEERSSEYDMSRVDINDSTTEDMPSILVSMHHYETTSKQIIAESQKLLRDFNEGNYRNNEEYNKAKNLFILSLYQLLKICKSAEAKEAREVLISALYKLLKIESNFFHNFISREELIQAKLAEKEISVPAYNRKMILREQCEELLLSKYEELLTVSENQNNAPRIRQMLRSLNQHGDLRDDRSYYNKSRDPDLTFDAVHERFDFAEFKRKQREYKKVRDAFEYFKDHQYKAIFRHKDDETYNLLVFLLHLYGEKGCEFLEEQYKKFFSEEKPSDPEAQLNEFLKVVTQNFMRIAKDEEQHLENAGISREERINLICEPLKRTINRWAQKYSLDQRIQNNKGDILNSGEANETTVHNTSHEKYEYKVVNNPTPPKHEKINKHNLKKKFKGLGTGTAFVVSLGQMAITIFALMSIGFAPPLAIPFGLATLFTNYKLFKGDLTDVLKQFFVEKDYFNECGGKYKKGKLLKGLMVGVLGVALGSALVTSILTFISVMFLPFPPLLLIPVAGVITATTLVGITALLYTAIARIPNKIIDLKRSIDEKGGLRNLFNDFIEENFRKKWRKRDEPELSLALDGTEEEFKNGILLDYKMKLLENRVEVTLGTAIKALFCVLGSVAFVFATIAGVTAVAAQVASIFSKVLPGSVGTFFTWAVVGGLYGVTEAIFNFTTMVPGYSCKLADAVTNHIVKPIFKHTYKFFKSPKRFFTDIDKSLGRGWDKTKFFFKNLRNNPQQSLLPVLGGAIKLFECLVLLPGNAIGSSALSLGGASTLQKIFGLGPKVASVATGVSAFVESKSANGLAILDGYNSEVPAGGLDEAAKNRDGYAEPKKGLTRRLLSWMEERRDSIQARSSSNASIDVENETGGFFSSFWKNKSRSQGSSEIRPLLSSSRNKSGSILRSEDEGYFMGETATPVR